MAPSLNIVVVEDHNRLRDVLVQVLTNEGHRVVGLSCAEDVEDEIGHFIPDLFVIDIGLPGEDGLSLTGRLRVSHPNVGIILATAHSSLDHRLHGYQSGADIFLPKPLDHSELLAAIIPLARRLRTAERALLQLNSSAGPNSKMSTSSVSGVEILLHSMTMELVGPMQTLALSQSECLLLAALARAPSQTLEHWQVARNLGQSDDGASKSSVEVRVARLRKKLHLVSGQTEPLKAIRTYGYKLCVPMRIA